MEVTKSGLIFDNERGLYIPETYRGRRLPANITTLETFPGALNSKGFNEGYRLNRDNNNLIAKWPQKGTGLDDYVCGQIVDGNIGNVGVAPVIAPQISALVRRFQNQSTTATLEISGKKSPVNKAKDAIAYFNNSPKGATDSMQQIVHDFCAYNRGAPIATVPLTYDMDVWETYGLTPIPILAEGQKEENANRFYLEVDWSKVGTPVPFLPSIFDLEPTGDYEWPYWYYARRGNDRVWVLLHHDHILPLTPGFSSKYAVGTSPVWMCLGYLAENILVVDERLEKMINTYSAGLVIVNGISETADQVKTKVEKTEKTAKSEGRFIMKDYTLLVGPPGTPINFLKIPFREDSGIDFEKRRQWEEDILALCFDTALSSVVTRGGIGFGVQAETIADVNAESGVESILRMVAITLGAIYPRVSIQVKRENDRAQRLNMETLNTFADSVSKLPPGTITTEETRAIIERDILEIPDVTEGFSTTGANSDENIEDDNANPAPQNEGNATEENGGAVENSLGAGDLLDVWAFQVAMKKSGYPLSNEDALFLHGLMSIENAPKKEFGIQKLQVLYNEGGVIITDSDVTRAIEESGKIDPQLEQILNANAVDN